MTTAVTKIFITWDWALNNLVMPFSGNMNGSIIHRRMKIPTIVENMYQISIEVSLSVNGVMTASTANMHNMIIEISFLFIL